MFIRPTKKHKKIIPTSMNEGKIKKHKHFTVTSGDQTCCIYCFQMMNVKQPSRRKKSTRTVIPPSQ